MTAFDQLRSIGEKIVTDRNLSPDHLHDLMGKTFLKTDKQMPHHDVYLSDAETNGLFGLCELRMPKTHDATNALLSCELPGGDIPAEDVQKAYDTLVGLSLASATAPETQPHYLYINFDGGKISFGYDRNTNMLTRLVIDFSK